MKLRVIYLAVLASNTSTTFVYAAEASEKSIKLSYRNEEIIKVIDDYSKASGQKFIIDPAVKGKVSIFNQEATSLEEGFNQLSSALALNSVAISRQGDTMVVKSARSIQRNLIEVSTERPSLKPERMFTWVYKVKHVLASNLSRDLRILLSKDGEMNINSSTNQMIFTDWTSNLNRVAEVLEVIDQPVDSSTARLLEEAKKDTQKKK